MINHWICFSYMWAINIQWLIFKKVVRVVQNLTTLWVENKDNSNIQLFSACGWE
jgi:hypothetical protein